MMFQFKNLVFRYVVGLNKYHLTPENYQNPKKATRKVIKGQVTEVTKIQWILSFFYWKLSKWYRNKLESLAQFSKDIQSFKKAAKRPNKGQVQTHIYDLNLIDTSIFLQLDMLLQTNKYQRKLIRGQRRPEAHAKAKKGQIKIDQNSLYIYHTSIFLVKNDPTDKNRIGTCRQNNKGQKVAQRSRKIKCKLVCTY